MTKEELIEEIDKERKWLDSAGYNAYNIDVAFEAIIKKVRDNVNIVKLLKIISDICNNEEICSNHCPFYDDEVNVGNCLLVAYDPCDWDLNKIKNIMESENNKDDTNI